MHFLYEILANVKAVNQVSSCVAFPLYLAIIQTLCEMGAKMSEADRQAAFLRQYQERFEKKLRDKEIELLEHWREQLLRVLGRPPEGVAALQLQIRKIADMMGNRIKLLKRD